MVVVAAQKPHVTPPSPDGAPLWLKLFGAFAVLCLAALVPTLLLPRGRYTADLLTVLDDPGLVFTVAALLFARSRARGTPRTVWGLFAAGVAAWLVGEVVYELRDAFGAGPATSVADLFYLLFYPPVMAGLLLLGREEKRSDRPGALLDVVIVMGGMALLLWTLVREHALTASGNAMTQGVNIAYVALGLGVLWMLVLPVLRTEARWTRSRTYLAWAFVGIVAADTIWVITPTDAYGLLASSSIVLLGLTAARTPNPEPAPPDPAAARRHHLTVEVAVVGVGALAAALMAWLTIRGGTQVDLVLGAGALLVLVLARMVVSVTVNEDLLRASERRASVDPLTALLNHRSFRENLTREVARAGRSQDSLALLCVDLDHLKAVNDLGGHLAGDRVLLDIADVLRATCRATDVVCRVGGDEMAVIAPATSLAQAGRLAERLVRAAHAVRVDALGDDGETSLSIGISVFPDLAADKPALLAQADAALYAAKQRGRDGWMTFDAGRREQPTAALDRAGALLAARDADFRAVFTYALEPMIITDHAPTILYANDAAVRLTGLPREHVVGRNLSEFIAGTDSAALSDILESIGVSSRQVGTIRVVFPGRPEALLEFAASRFSPECALVGLRDITDRTKAEKDLSRSEARFRGLFDGALDAMFITDDTGQITDANPAATKLTGHSRPELVGMSVADLGPDEDRERIDQATAQLLREHVLVGAGEFVDASGATRVVEYTTAADFVPGEHLSIVRDITARADQHVRSSAQPARSG